MLILEKSFGRWIKQSSGMGKRAHQVQEEEEEIGMGAGMAHRNIISNNQL